MFLVNFIKAGHELKSNFVTSYVIAILFEAGSTVNSSTENFVAILLIPYDYSSSTVGRTNL